MRKQDKEKTTVQVSLRISKIWIEKLEELAKQETILQDKNINYIDLIRLAVKQYYNLEE